MNFFIAHLTSVNLIAIFVSAIVSFLLGSFWFSTLFGQIWVEELKKNNVFIQQPTSATLIMKMVLTFLGNFISSLVMALLVIITHSTTFFSAFELGFLIAVGFVITSIGISFVWSNRSLKLSLIDIGYPVVGIITSAIILSLWR